MQPHARGYCPKGQFEPPLMMVSCRTVRPCPLWVKSRHAQRNSSCPARAINVDEPLLSDQRSTSFGMEVVEELVATGGQGPEADYAFAISRHNFFNP